MSKSTPSLLALLGLVAVAGYQNRDRISDMLADARQAPPSPRLDDRTLAAPRDQTASRDDGGFLSEIGGLFGGSSSGSTLLSGLSDLVSRFKDAGQQSAADSWVSSRPNMPLAVQDLEATLGDETLTELGQKTGLTRDELLLRLNVALPQVVDRFSPQGRLPTETEARDFG